MHMMTHIAHFDEDGDPAECAVRVFFDSTKNGHYRPATRTDPAEHPEFDVRFSHAEPYDKHDPPLTGAEIAALRIWFDSHAATATEIARESDELSL